MRTTILAAGAALLLAAGPALAQTVETAPALGFADRLPAHDTGSAQFQRGDGPVIAAQSEQVTVPNASEAEPQSLNSLPR